MALNKYYQDELTALRQLGREFSYNNPRLAPFLAVEAQDPDVERLLEGFAFLAGRIRQKLDDELPEVTQSLMSLLWPDFLRPIPAMTMMAFSPMHNLSEKKTIKRGVELKSVPVDGTQCIFRTCQNVDIYPLTVSSVQKSSRPTGSSINMVLNTTHPVAMSQMQLGSLRLSFHGDTLVSHTLYLYLSRHLSAVIISGTDSSGNCKPLMTLGSDAMKPAGFDPDESLLPYSPFLFDGNRLLLEYFSFPEKFLAMDLNGLEKLQSLAKTLPWVDKLSTLHFEFLFSRPLDSKISLGVPNIRLFTSPAINLLTHEAVPIRWDHRNTEYRVIPLGDNHRHFEVFSIDRVRGWGHKDRKMRQYSRFESFEHAQQLEVTPQIAYFKERNKPAVNGNGVDTYLSFVDSSDLGIEPQLETISIDLTCTNRHLPAELGIGDIKIATSSSPEYARFENITNLTPSYMPPMEEGMHWRLISSLSLGHLSLSSLDTLKTLLTTYDYKSHYDRQQARASQHRLNGLETMTVTPESRLFKGIPVRGNRTKLVARESHFAGEADLYLFGCLLNELLAISSTANTYHLLEISCIEKGEHYRWKPKLGYRQTL